MTLPAPGIDIAKLKFNVCLIRHSGKLKHIVFPNSETGFEQLKEWLSRQGVERVHACLEATGTYSEALSLCLHQAGHTVSVINPAAIKAFAGSRLSRTKTDRVDAELIARFCLAQEPARWTPPPAEVRELQALVRRLERLRRARYLPAITALRCSPFFQQWGEGLQERGQSKRSVICAVMRKLLHIAYGVLKNGKEFDPQWAKSA